MLDLTTAIAKAIFEKITNAGGDLPEVIATQYVRDPWEESPTVNLVAARCDVGPGSLVSERIGRKGMRGTHKVFILLRQFMESPTLVREEELLVWHAAVCRLLSGRESLDLTHPLVNKATFSHVEASENLQHLRDKRVLSFYAELVYTTHE